MDETVQEYHVITTDGRIWSWSGSSIEQVRKDFFERCRLIQSIQPWSEYEIEMGWKQREYQAELNEAIENAGKEVA